MIEGCLDWQANGLVKPPSVVAATEEYFSDQDLFALKLTEECDCDPGNSEKSEISSTLFKSWKEYAVAAGNAPGSRSNLSKTRFRSGKALNSSVAAGRGSFIGDPGSSRRASFP